MTAKIRIGMVGCGLVARRHAKWLAVEERAELRACYDPLLESAQGFAAQFAPSAAIATDEDAIFARDDLDAVILCSPTLRHYDQVCRALDRGWHVLCEKPLAGQREQIVDIIARHAGSDRI